MQKAEWGWLCRAVTTLWELEINQKLLSVTARWPHTVVVLLSPEMLGSLRGQVLLTRIGCSVCRFLLPQPCYRYQLFQVGTGILELLHSCDGKPGRQQAPPRAGGVEAEREACLRRWLSRNVVRSLKGRVLGCFPGSCWRIVCPVWSPPDVTSARGSPHSRHFRLVIP